MLQNTANPYLQKQPELKACKSLWNHVCKNLLNLGISAQACLQKLAKVHAFCTCESLRKHNLQKPCKMLWKVYLCWPPHPHPHPCSGLARSSTSLLSPVILNVFRLFVITIQKPIVSAASSPWSAPNALLSRYANQPMMKYKVSYSVVSSA